MAIRAIENFKALSKPKKVAAIAGGVVAAAAVATTITAAVKGKNAFNGEDKFTYLTKNNEEKVLDKGILNYIKVGFAQIGSGIKAKFDKIVEHFKKHGAENAGEGADKAAAEAGAGVDKAAAEAGEAADKVAGQAPTPAEG